MNELSQLDDEDEKAALNQVSEEAFFAWLEDEQVDRVTDRMDRAIWPILRFIAQIYVRIATWFTARMRPR